MLILGLLWVFQVFSLESFYQTTIINQLNTAGRTIELSYENENIEQILEETAIANSGSVVLVREDGTVLYSISNSTIDPLLNDFGEALFALKMQLNSDEDGETYNNYSIPRLDIEFIVYGKALDVENNGQSVSLFISSPLVPVGSTIQIIQGQLFFITIIVFELAIIIALYLSRRISRPILKITKDIKQFAKGEYNVNFSGDGYAETEELAQVLNYAEEEISKVDGLRRELISNISHDLRTPLTIIKGYAEMVRDLSGDNKVKREEHLAVIIEESDRLSNLVVELLELSKYESGNQELNLSIFETEDFLDEVMARYKIFAEKDGYEFNLIQDENVEVLADRAKILQVIFNFINNAINYTGDSKKITIRQINKEDYIRFEVIDNGIGIPKENLPQIFDRYYREKKVERETTGTGLGLSIVKGILKLHNYPFGVTSQINEGSTFWFELKRQKSK